MQVYQENMVYVCELSVCIIYIICLSLLIRSHGADRLSVIK